MITKKKTPTIFPQKCLYEGQDIKQNTGTNKCKIKLSEPFVTEDLELTAPAD